MTAHLVQLNTDSKSNFADIQYFVTPLDEVHGLLGQVQGVLKKPEDFHKKLGDVFDVLNSLETVCRSGTWIPEVGAAAKGAANFLGGINDVIRPTRDALNQIRTDIKPLQDWLQKLKAPIDKGWSAVGQVEGKVEVLANVTSSLRAHYKDEPPKGLENCAAVLNGPIHPLVVTLNDAKDEANAGLQEAERPLRVAWEALGRLLDFTKVIDGAFSIVGALQGFVHSISTAIGKALNYGKTAIEDAISWAGRHAFPKTYEKVKAMMAAVDTQITNMRKRLVDFLFKPVRDAMAHVAQTIKDKLSKLPVITRLETAIKQIENGTETITHAIEAQADPCKGVLSGQVAPSG